MSAAISHRHFGGRISRPVTAGTLVRMRLFDLLDHHGDVWWVMGPAGGGKTIVISGWLEARNKREIWCCLDAADAEPATFFAHLTAAAKPLLPAGHTLPRWTPVEMIAPESFSQRFFQSLWNGLDSECVVVLDDFHQLHPQSPIAALLVAGWNTLEHGRLIVLGREPPAAPFMPWLDQKRMRVLDWPELRFNLEECRQIVMKTIRKSCSDAEVESIYWQSDGWATGIILLLASQIEGGEERAAPLEMEPGPLFEYFARQVMVQLADKEQEFFLRLSALPVFSPRMAGRLTGYARADQELASLYRRHLFIARFPQPTGRVLYQFHGLFRDFLRSLAHSRFTQEELKELRLKAGSIAEEEGFVEEAARLWIEAEAWEPLVRLILREAPALADKGRFATLEHWLSILPEGSLASSPWLAYWFGTAIGFRQPREGRRWLEVAWCHFEVAGETEAAWACWCGVLESFQLETDELGSLPTWLERYQRLWQSRDSLPFALEARILSNWLFLKTFVDSGEEDILSVRARLLRLVHVVPPVMRAAICNNLLLHSIWRGHLAQLDLLDAHLEAWFEDPSLPPLLRLSAITAKGISCLLRAQLPQSRWVEEKVWSLIEQFPSLGQVPLVVLFTVGLAITEENFPRATKLLERFRTEVSSLPGSLTAVYFHYYSSLLALATARLAAARFHGEQAMALAEALGASDFWLIQSYYLAVILDAEGETERVKWLLLAVQQRLQRSTSPIIHLGYYQLSCVLSFKAGRREEGCVALREALHLMRIHDHLLFAGWGPGWHVRLCHIALEEGIEVDFVQRIVRSMGLLPIPAAQLLQMWPWPIRIRTFGGLEILIEGQPLVCKGKGQAKPLALLKLILARGGQGVVLHELSDQLWEDAEATSASNNLSTTLHRLRRLLGNPDILQISEGRVTLNSALCQLDLWGVERLTREIDDLLTHKQRDFDRLGEIMRQLLALYRGPFLPMDDDLPWVLGRRDHWRILIARHMVRAGQEMVSNGHAGTATPLLDRALDVDPLAETIYQCLMEYYLHQGAWSEVERLYRRCATNLAQVLGTSPSHTIERLRRQLPRFQSPPV